MRSRLKTGDAIVIAKIVRFASTSENYWPQKAEGSDIALDNRCQIFGTYFKLSNFEQTAKTDYL